jgi:hypothetical protein
LHADLYWSKRDVKGGWPLTLQLFVQHNIRKESLVGELVLPVEIPANFDGPKGWIHCIHCIVLRLIIHKFTEIQDQTLVKKKKRVGTVSFDIERLSYSGQDESLRLGLGNTNVRAAAVVHTSAAVGAVTADLQEAASLAGEVKNEHDVWKKLEENVEFVVKIGNEIASVSWSLYVSI